MTDFQIQRLLQERRLEDYAAVDSEVVGFLEKTVRAIADAQAGISEEGAFLRAYEATFLCATAAILNAGYRIRGSVEGHHHNLVLILRHLGVPKFTDLGNRWERLKRLRNQSMYDGDARPRPEDVADMENSSRPCGRKSKRVAPRLAPYFRRYLRLNVAGLQGVLCSEGVSLNDWIILTLEAGVHAGWVAAETDNRSSSLLRTTNTYKVKRFIRMEGFDVEEETHALGGRGCDQTGETVFEAQ